MLLCRRDKFWWENPYTLLISRARRTVQPFSLVSKQIVVLSRKFWSAVISVRRTIITGKNGPPGPILPGKNGPTLKNLVLVLVL